MSQADGGDRRPSLSVIVLTKNESRQIGPCLDSVAGADELLVIDDFSDDDTTQLARQAGAKILQRPLDTFAAQRNFALSQAQGDWVFFLDADERLSPGLMSALRRHMLAPAPRSGRLIRRNFAFGRRHRFGPLKPDRVTRLFRRSQVHWEGAVHERPVSSDPPAELAGYLIHHTYRDWPQYLTKQRRYAELWAQQAQASGRSATVWTALWRAGAGLFKMLFLNLGLLGGPLSWALCWQHASYTLNKYLILAYNLQRPDEN